MLQHRNAVQGLRGRGALAGHWARWANGTSGGKLFPDNWQDDPLLAGLLGKKFTTVYDGSSGRHKRLKQYGHHVVLDDTAPFVGQNTTNVPRTVVNPKKITDSCSQLYDEVYANLLFHEAGWHGIAGRMDDTGKPYGDARNTHGLKTSGLYVTTDPGFPQLCEAVKRALANKK